MINKDNLNLAGEYATASEICRRNFYAQITLGHLKRTDILVYNQEKGKMLRIEVKAKQKNEWPGIKGVNDKQTLLIFVDFENKKDRERPDFYILNALDWKIFLESHVINRPSFDKLIDNYIPKYKDGWTGTGIKPDQIFQHKEKWEKIVSILED